VVTFIGRNEQNAPQYPAKTLGAALAKNTHGKDDFLRPDQN
jgi:hypothetical protein